MRSTRGARAAALGVACASAVALLAALVAAGALARGTAVPGAAVGANWAQANGNAQGGRYSALRQINTANVKSLRPVWTYKSSDLGTEDYPLEVDGTAYVAANGDYVYALDARTGSLKWSWIAPSNGQVSTWGPLGPRGLGYGAGQVFVAAGDAVLYSLNATTGAVDWSLKLASPKLGYGETVAPLYYDGVIYIGSSGSDLGARGFEMAVSATTHKVLWTHYNAPPPGTGWEKATGVSGGGDVWETPTLDPAAGVLYIGTGNPAPDLYGLGRPGPDPWTDSIVAISMKTGKTVWGFQEAPHDLWDYDAASPPVMFPTGAGMGIGEAGKDGYWYELSSTSGTLLTMPEAFVIENHVAPPTKGRVLNWPGTTGGSEWSPVPYDPQTGFTYVSGNNIPNWEHASAAKAKQGGDAFGTITTPGPKNDMSGTFTAFNVESGTVAWQIHEPVPMVGGATATAGGLVFTAQSGNGVLEALNAKTGQVVWHYDVHGPVDTAPSIYEVGGREYVIYAIGGSDLGKATYGGKYNTTKAFFIAFALHG